jgi:carboxylesterase type B
LLRSSKCRDIFARRYLTACSYRLGIFGFSGAPGIEANAALFDHRVAVEWVHDNIAAFGGDPSRIVIFGQSAGGASVDYWSFAWKDKPLVSGLISMSGTSLSFLPNTQDYAQMLWYNVSQTIGCGGPHDPTAEVLSCVRSRNTSVILAAAAKVPPLPTQATVQATFHPTIDNITVYADYEQLSASGAFAKIPLLAGNAAKEDGWYRLAGYASRLNFTESQWTLFRERAFTCPNSDTTKHRVQYGVPTWRYIYDGDWDNLRLYNGSAGLAPEGSGAYHGSDLNMIFGTAEDVSGLENTPSEDATSRYMMGAWAAFARDSKAGLEEYGWPQYNENGMYELWDIRITGADRVVVGATLARLAYNNGARPEFVDPVLYDEACPEKNDPLPGRGAF